MTLFISIAVIAVITYTFLFIYFKIENKYFLGLDIEHPCVILCFITLLVPFCNFMILVTLIFFGIAMLIFKCFEILKRVLCHIQQWLLQ